MLFYQYKKRYQHLFVHAARWEIKMELMESLNLKLKIVVLSIVNGL
jgi:hypothetical protein